MIRQSMFMYGILAIVVIGFTISFVGAAHTFRYAWNERDHVAKNGYLYRTGIYGSVNVVFSIMGIAALTAIIKIDRFQFWQLLENCG